MRIRRTVLGGLVVMLLTGLVGCGGGDGEDDNVLGGRKTADLVVEDQRPFYDPENLELPLNREVTFTVFNDGKKVHNITIPGFAIDMDVQPKQSIDIKLPATSAPPRDGFYSFYCKFHQSEGEAGRINISR